MILQDIWVVPQTANPTHDFGGAANSWASVTIENDTTFSIAVNPQQGNPPTGLVDAWRVIPPGANVTWPLYSNGVSYRVLGTPSSSTVVQTVLSTDAAPAGGTTGSVNVASGTVNVTGPVNVQTAAGVNLSMFSGFATATTIAINAGTTTLSIPLSDNVQKLFLLYGQAVPGGSSPVTITVTGDTTGVRYFRGPLGRQDMITLVVAGKTSSTGISIDASVTVAIVAGVAGGDIVVVQSYAAPAMSANDLLPTNTHTATTTYEKNLFVVPVPSKALVQFSSTVAGPSALIAAPGVGFALSLRTFQAVPRTIVAGNTFALQNPTGPTNLLIYGSAGVPGPYDFGGWCLPENTGIQVAQVAPLAVWDVTLTFAVVTLA